MRSFIIKPGDLIPIGRAGENQATQIRFDVTGWADTFGAGTYTLVVKRPHEDTAYPVEVTTDGYYVVWTVSNVDTGIAGNASVQLRYVVDGALAKSVIYTGIVGESLDNIVDPPDPFEDLIQRMVDLTERTEAAATSAAGSAASASESAGTATAAKNAAQTAAQAAQTAQATATQAAQTATQAKDAAQAAQQAAEVAKSAAAQSATAASGSATAAAGSASQAAASATAADASANAAAQSAAAAQAAAMDVIDKATVITDTASGAIASFPDGSAAPIKSITINIEPVQSGEGDPSPTNIRPITGWTGANVVRKNANLWNNDWYTLGNAMTLIDDTTDQFYGYYNGAVKTWYNNQGSIMQLLRNGVDKLTVTADYGNKSNSNAFVFKAYFQYEDGTVDASSSISVPSSGTNTATRQSSGDKKVIGFSIGTTAGATNLNGCIKNVMVSADDLTVYVAPQTTTYPITFPSEAGTVYGGTLTVEQDGTGTLVVERRYVIFGSASDYTWNTGSGVPYLRKNLSSANKAKYSKRDLTISNQYSQITSASTTNKAIRITSDGAAIFIYDSRFTNEATANTLTAANPIEVVYPLAAPITYTLTASQMRTLLGQNNWWVDCGDIAEINYRCDTAKYIDKKLAALLAALS